MASSAPYLYSTGSPTRRGYQNHRANVNKVDGTRNLIPIMPSYSTLLLVHVKPHANRSFTNFSIHMHIPSTLPAQLLQYTELFSRAQWQLTLQEEL